MTIRQAEKLHNEDEVTIKKTGEVVTVLSAYTDVVEGKKTVFIEACSKRDGFMVLSHKEIC